MVAFSRSPRPHAFFVPGPGPNRWRKSIWCWMASERMIPLASDHTDPTKARVTPGGGGRRPSAGELFLEARFRPSAAKKGLHFVPPGPETPSIISPHRWSGHPIVGGVGQTENKKKKKKKKEPRTSHESYQGQVAGSVSGKATRHPPVGTDDRREDQRLGRRRGSRFTAGSVRHSRKRAPRRPSPRGRLFLAGCAK